MATKQKKKSTQSTANGSQETTCCITDTRSEAAKPRRPPRLFGKDHPSWAGDNPPSPYPVGTILGRLRVESPVLLRENGALHIECKCLDCGVVFRPSFYNVKKGMTTRCTKCGHKAARLAYVTRIWRGRIPDETDQMLRNKWFAMMGRCRDPLNQQYHNYGGRGIKVDPLFDDPLNFIDYMKALPGVDPGRDRGRIDNDKGYEPGNLEWQTPQDCYSLYIAWPIAC